MSGPAVEHVYRYPFPSSLDGDGRERRLRLATSAQLEGPSWFVSARLTRPRVTADLLRGLVQVVQSRFHTPPAMVARILAAADPVITSNGDVLRWEAFSACASTYARVDLEASALDGELTGRGTTNVDFNAPLRTALARIRDFDHVDLHVGSASLELSARGETLVERKVPLPIRWLMGFVEVQSYQAAMSPALEVSGLEASRFLKSFPRQGSRHTCWVRPAGRGVRLSHQEGAGGIPVGGIQRLRVLENLAPLATRLKVFADLRSRTSTWMLDFENARFHLVLSPETWRGFSGEGQALETIAGGDWKETLRRVQSALQWQSRVDVAAVAASTFRTVSDVTSALSVLGSRGLCGFDLAEGAYFHRQLPFDLSRVEQLQPRLLGARRLVEQGEVKLVESDARGNVEAEVIGSGVVHRVKMTPKGNRCSCPWDARHRGERGPCKHLLAVQLILDREAES